ncbi:MAG: ABC transporter permease [Planctomycetota bacterium]
MKWLMLREWRHLAGSASTWIAATALAFASGFVFLMNLDQSWEWDLGGLLGTLSLLLLFAGPALSMQRFAQERESGCWSILRSDPVGSVALVGSKFIVVFAFYSLLATLISVSALLFISSRGGDFDMGRQLSAFLAHLLLAGWHLSLGLCASAHARTTLGAFMGAFVIALGFILLGGAGDGPGHGWVGLVAVDPHLSSFRLGILRLQDLVYFLSAILLGLVLATRSVWLEVRRSKGLWKIPLWILAWLILQKNMATCETSWDLTRHAATRPSDEAVSALEGRGPVRFVGVWAAQDELAPLARSYLNNLAGRTRGVTAEFWNLEERYKDVEALLRDYGIDPGLVSSPGGIFVIKEGRARFLSSRLLVERVASPGRTPFRRWAAEPLLVRQALALSRVGADRLAVIKACGSEGESEGQGGLQWNALRAAGFEIEEVEPQALDPARHPLAFLCNPREPWGQLKTILDQYLGAGGKLILTLEPGSQLPEGPMDPSTHILRGLDRRRQGHVGASLPEHLKRSYGDMRAILMEPLAMEVGTGGRELMSARGVPVAVIHGSMAMVGDTDWLRSFLQQEAPNRAVLVLLVETVLGRNADHYTRSVSLDVQVESLGDEDRSRVVLWMLGLIPGMVALIGVTVGLLRRFG